MAGTLPTRVPDRLVHRADERFAPGITFALREAQVVHDVPERHAGLRVGERERPSGTGVAEHVRRGSRRRRWLRA